MRIAAYQFSSNNGDVVANVEKIRKAAVLASGNLASLLVCPELAICGYGAGEGVLASSHSVDELALLLKPICEVA